MVLQKAELTPEEQTLLEFVGGENPPYLLEYTVDDTVKSLQINTYELQDGAWKLLTGGGGTALDEAQGRIALTFDNIGLGLRTAVEHKGANSYRMENDFNFDGLSRSTSYLSDTLSIAYEKEIPLVIQIHTAKSSVFAYPPGEGFFKAQAYADLGYEKVYAITCLFSRKTVEELSEQTS